MVLSQLLARYIEGVAENTFLTADSSVFSSSAGGWVGSGVFRKSWGRAFWGCWQCSIDGTHLRQTPMQQHVVPCNFLSILYM